MSPKSASIIGDKVPAAVWEERERLRLLAKFHEGIPRHIFIKCHSKTLFAEIVVIIIQAAFVANT